MLRLSTSPSSNMTEQGPPVSPQESNNDEGWNPVLDTDEIYDPDPEALAFFMAETGINDGMELRRHILAVQKEAFAVYKYPCIRMFEFMRLKLARLPAYHLVLELCQERTNAIFLDMGCCFGNDSRKLIRDGWPVENVVASDLRGGGD
ncbi:hypothetical protein BC629DRAFT_1499626 [Irpex lacteus]|nr:hypothetical protein BC629DRAFT_1499626 [Irpex lacteus]